MFTHLWLCSCVDRILLGINLQNDPICDFRTLESLINKYKKSKCVFDYMMWKGNYDRSGIILEVSMDVILNGNPTIYGPSGRMSFVADTVDLGGEGALHKPYATLIKTVEAGGLLA